MVAALVLIGCIAPFVNAIRFSGKIQDALQSSLGRKVTFAEAHFSLFSGVGFSLEKVAIAEDPGFGIEPFAYVPVLQARLRLDKLFVGQIRFASLRLVEPSLNMVKRSDGTWNVVRLLERLSAPRHAPLNLFPFFQVAGGRVDFKIGRRKTTLYISESDLSIYPQRSGKVSIRFSGSPARTDRAGNGFGHFRGTVNWAPSSSSAPPELNAQLLLDPSNLSELTTLFEGHDLGVHGTISSAVRIQGPASALQIDGNLHLTDVHRWDLLPASGEDWTVHYGGTLDLLARRYDLRTLPSYGDQPMPVTLHVRASDTSSPSSSSLVAELKDAPLGDLLPLAARMGVSLPNGAALHGALTGAVGYSSDAGWSGSLAIQGAQAVLPGAPTLRTAVANVTIARESAHFDPAIIQTDGGGTILLSGDYYYADGHSRAYLDSTNVSVSELKPILGNWFGDLPSLAAIREGDITGNFSYSERPNVLRRSITGTGKPFWSGRFEMSKATISIPALALPLANSHGRVSFNDTAFEVDRLVANLGDLPVRASYRYDLAAEHPEHLRIDLARADLLQLQAALVPTIQAGGLWGRLAFLKRPRPAWIESRDLAGDMIVREIFAAGRPMGSLDSHFFWDGTQVVFDNLTLALPKGHVSAQGSVDLAYYRPRWQVVAKAFDYPWAGGSLAASGNISGVGLGKDVVSDVSATGSFEGKGLQLASSSGFESLSGLFRLSFDDGWPDLRLTDLQALSNGDQWSGAGAAQSDGKVILDLSRAGKQLHIVTSLEGESAPALPVPFSDVSQR